MATVLAQAWHLEAARLQGKYWQALEAVLASQSIWASHDDPRPELVWNILGTAGVDIAQAKADLARAAASLASADLQVRDTVLTSPAAGVILTRAQEPGAILQAGANVLTLSLLRPVWVRAYVAEPDLGRIHPGTRVEVHTDSRPGQPYAGQVGYISPRAEFTPRNVETRELRSSLVYRFRVVMEKSDASLRQGLPVTVRVLQ